MTKYYFKISVIQKRADAIAQFCQDEGMSLAEFHCVMEFLVEKLRAEGYKVSGLKEIKSDSELRVESDILKMYV